MQFRFLGTGTSQGVPTIACKCAVCTSKDTRDRRNRAAALISHPNGQNLLIDAGADFRQQMLTYQVENLDYVLITHAHFDHIAGLEDLRTFCFIQDKAMPIGSTLPVLAALRERYAYIFVENPYPGSARFDLFEIDTNKPFSLGSFEVVPIEIMHGRLPILGFRFKDFTYITDCKTINAPEIEKIKGTKTLVVNALHHDVHPTHLNLMECLKLIKILAPEKAYITHVSHHMGLYTEVEKTLPPNVFLAYDGLVLDMD